MDFYVIRGTWISDYETVGNHVSSLFSFFGRERENIHPEINVHVVRLDRNARRDRYTPCHAMERTRNWHRRCRVNNWSHEMDTSVGVIYMNVWYVLACSKSEMRPLNVFPAATTCLLGFYSDKAEYILSEGTQKPACSVENEREENNFFCRSISLNVLMYKSA